MKKILVLSVLALFLSGTFSRVGAEERLTVRKVMGLCARGGFEVDISWQTEPGKRYSLQVDG